MSQVSTDSISRNDDWLRGRLKFSNKVVVKRPIKPIRRGYISDIKVRGNKLRNLNNPSLAKPIINNNSNFISDLVVKPKRRPQPTVSINRTTPSKVLKRNQFHVVPASKKYKKKKKNLIPAIMMSLAVVMFAVGVYSDISSLKNAHISQLQAANLTKIANKVSSTINSPSTTNTKPASVTNPAPSTVKPSTYSIANYTVPPNNPRYIIIPSLGVNARIFSVGLLANGALRTPSNVFDTDWYNQSALPGQPGAMLIDGHVSSWTSHGVFYGIKDLKPGNIIKIQTGAGTIFNYSVVKNQVFPSGNVDMNSTMLPVVPGQPGLNLITCTGDVIAGTSQFNERIVVYATLVK